MTWNNKYRVDKVDLDVHFFLISLFSITVKDQYSVIARSNIIHRYFYFSTRT